MHTSFGPPDIVRPAIDEDEMCQGIKWMPRLIFPATSPVTHVGDDAQVMEFTVSFDARETWGFLRQAKGSLSSSLQTFFLP
jgi:hypothetical protein